MDLSVDSAVSAVRGNPWLWGGVALGAIVLVMAVSNGEASANDQGSGYDATLGTPYITYGGYQAPTSYGSSSGGGGGSGGVPAGIVSQLLDQLQTVTAGGVSVTTPTGTPLPVDRSFELAALQYQENQSLRNFQLGMANIGLQSQANQNALTIAGMNYNLGIANLSAMLFDSLNQPDRTVWGSVSYDPSTGGFIADITNLNVHWANTPDNIAARDAFYNRNNNLTTRINANTALSSNGGILGLPRNTTPNATAPVSDINNPYSDPEPNVPATYAGNAGNAANAPTGQSGGNGNGTSNGGGATNTGDTGFSGERGLTSLN